MNWELVCEVCLIPHPNWFPYWPNQKEPMIGQMPVMIQDKEGDSKENIKLGKSARLLLALGQSSLVRPVSVRGQWRWRWAVEMKRADKQ